MIMSTKILKYGLGVFSKVGNYPTMLSVAEKTKVNAPSGVFVVQKKDDNWMRQPQSWCKEQLDGSRIQYMEKYSHGDNQASERSRQAWFNLFPEWEGETCEDFVTIHIPDGFASPVPVWLELGVASHVTIVAGKGCKITIEEDRLVSGHAAAVVSLWLGERAEVTYLSKRLVARDGDEHLVRDVWIEAEANLRLREAYLEGGLARSYTHACLAGEGAAIDVRNIFFGNQERCFDLLHEVKHFRPNTRSALRTFGALKDQSHVIARSLVRIEKEAEGSKASQKFEALLLSDTVGADPIPTLEIENHKVSCGHSASVSRPNEEKLFYLMSRGLDRDAALREYVGGFLRSGIADEFDYRSYEVSVAVDEKLSRYETD